MARLSRRGLEKPSGDGAAAVTGGVSRPEADKCALAGSVGEGALFACLRFMFPSRIETIVATKAGHGRVDRCSFISSFARLGQ